MSACALAGCERPVKTLRICNLHYLRAKREGNLDALLDGLPPRLCGHCGERLPLRARSGQLYCNKTCVNAAAWQRDPETLLAATREWRQRTREKRRAETVARRAGRMCEECDAPIPPESWTRRRFCSRACVNRKSLRDQAHQRREANRRRKRRLAAATSAPAGITQRDWQSLVRRYDHSCAYCHTRAPLTLDHVVPLARGGRHSIGNALPACGPCNSSKKDLLLIDWRTRILPQRIAA